MRNSLFRKIFSPLFCFKQEKTLRNFSKTVTLYKYDKENKEEAAAKSSVWDLNIAQTSTNPPTVKRYEAGKICIGLFSFLIIS